MRPQGGCEVVVSNIPSRMDRLPWSRWHWLVVIGLGITWILDGLEVTIVGSLGGVLTNSATLGLTSTEVGLAASIYILGAVSGSLLFGYLTDRLGRKRLFMVTLGVYLVATIATAFSFNFLSFAIFRFFTGMGIGGEYSAINSAIDELIPSRVRGWADLAINGSYWIGAIIGAASTLVLLNPALFPINLGWRLAFGLGATLGIIILFVRRYVPESPRWLLIHGRLPEAEQTVRQIETDVQIDRGLRELPQAGEPLSIEPRGSIGFDVIAKTMFRKYPQRSVLGFTLMVGQAFFYNAIFFTYALVLTTFYAVPPDTIGLYIIPFAIGNVLGPLILGRLFDTLGRRTMITFTYGISAVLLAFTGYLFAQGALTAVTQTIAWSIIFFFASAGASSAYLTVSEVFPLEVRAMAIAFFYALGTGGGGFIGPLLFGYLISTASATNVFYGDLIGAAFMAAGAVAELLFGVRAERKMLEGIAEPLSAVGVGERPLPFVPRSITHVLRSFSLGRGAGAVTMWCPVPPSLTPSIEQEYSKEVKEISEAVQKQGPTDDRRLADLVGARNWAPGRFRMAISIALEQQKIILLRPHVIGPPQA